jgi:hypothetical protein
VSLRPTMSSENTLDILALLCDYGFDSSPLVNTVNNEVCDDHQWACVDGTVAEPALPQAPSPSTTNLRTSCRWVSCRMHLGSPEYALLCPSCCQCMFDLGRPNRKNQGGLMLRGQIQLSGRYARYLV